MRVFLVASAVILMLFVAVAVCIGGSPVETYSGIELQLEEATPDLACAGCLKSQVHDYLYEHAKEARNIALASTARHVLKLPQVAVEAKHWVREAAAMKVEVGAVGVCSRPDRRTAPYDFRVVSPDLRV